jgi:hypothetical protein
MCLGAFEDFYPEGARVVHGPLTTQQARVRASSFEAQVVLARQLQALALNGSESGVVVDAEAAARDFTPREHGQCNVVVCQ